jgi:hypothetical protein
MNRFLACVLAIGSCVVLSCGPAWAQSSLAGARVAPTHDGPESQPRIISDHAGGAFVGFVGDLDTFFVARLRSDATPDPAWTALKVRGLGIEFPSGTRFAWLGPEKVVVFSDQYFAADTVNYLCRASSESGIVVPNLSTYSSITYLAPALVEQPNGTVLVTTLANESGALIAQLRTAIASPVTGMTEGFVTPLLGRVLSGATSRAVPADGGGAWVVGEVYGTTDPNTTDLIAARILQNGTSALSPTTYRVVCNATRDQKAPALVPDGSGGMIVTWQDPRTLATSDDIYASRLAANGSLVAGWTAGGKVICNATGVQVQPAIASDGAGGAWIAWSDGRSGESDIYFTHVLAGGTIAAGFPAGGASLCGATGGQVEVQLAADGTGGIFAVWLDSRDGEADLYGTHVASNATVVTGWAAGGSPISTHPTLQKSPRLLAMDPHRAFVVWADSRTGSERIHAAVMAGDQVLSAPGVRGAAALSLRATRAPSLGEVELVLGAADGEPVDVALLDIGGRVVARQRVEAGGGAVPVRFTGRLAPGLYLARARQGGQHAECRAIVVR